VVALFSECCWPEIESSGAARKSREAGRENMKSNTQKIRGASKKNFAEVSGRCGERRRCAERSGGSAEIWDKVKLSALGVGGT
jgi:hypothetical protein